MQSEANTMSRVARIGSTCLINVDIVISSGADFFNGYRYEEIVSNGGREGVDISNWKGYMAFAKGNTRVLQCDDCLTLNEEGFVNVHMPPEVTSQLKRGVYDYNIVLKTEGGYVISFVEGEATVSEIIPEVD